MESQLGFLVIKGWLGNVKEGRIVLFCSIWLLYNSHVSHCIFGWTFASILSNERNILHSYFCWFNQWDYVERKYYFWVSVFLLLLVFSHIFCIQNPSVHIKNHTARNTVSLEGITCRMAQSIKLHKSLIQFIPQISTFLHVLNMDSFHCTW